MENFAKSDAEALMSAVLPVAKRLLSELGEFHPFGGYMKTDGEIVHASVTDGTDHPKSQPLIDLLANAFRHQANDGIIRASAIVFDCRVIPPGHTEKSDAIALRLDHHDNYSIAVYVPYHRLADSSFIFGETFAHDGTYAIFSTTTQA